jgi:adenine-specific DNA-methyltransferase
VARSPRLVKILRLESYDDALHNLTASADREPGRAEALRNLVGESTYRLRYLFRLPLDVADTTLDLDKLERPFAYTLETLTDDGPKEVLVDIVETANVVLGVDVARYQTWEGPGGRPYLAVSGRRAGRRCLLLWRDLPGVDHIAERDFLIPRMEGYDEVLINGASATPGIQTIDPLLFAALEG